MIKKKTIKNLLTKLIIIAIVAAMILTGFMVIFQGF